MQCKEIMHRCVKSIAASDNVVSAARHMWEADVEFLPVCSDDGSVVGTVTYRDLTMRVLAESLPLTTSIADVMSNDPITVRADDNVRQAEEIMMRHRQSRLPCTLDGRLVGVVSFFDIAHKGDGRRARYLFEQGGSRGEVESSEPPVSGMDGHAAVIGELAQEAWHQLRRGVAGALGFPAAAAIGFAALMMTLSLFAEGAFTSRIGTIPSGDAHPRYSRRPGAGIGDASKQPGTTGGR